MRYDYDRYSDYRRSSLQEKLIIGGFIAFVVLIITTICYFAIPAIASTKIVKVLTYNTGFWIMLFVAAVFGLFRKLTNPEKFTWTELPIQLVASSVTILILYMLFYTTSGNLSDHELLNGYVEKAEYYEAWTEEVTYTEEEECGTDSDGNTKYCTVTKTREDYHPPSWDLVTTLGAISIDEGTYGNYVRHWGNEKKVNLNHMDQVSHGDGDMFFSHHAGTLDAKMVPASIEHHYLNYLKASDSIKKVSGQLSGFQELLKPYPKVYSAGFGPIEVDRVINAGVTLPNNWSNNLDRELDCILAQLGASKQVNVLVYVAKTADPQFGFALEEHWVKGKKNDVIVVIGLNQFPKIDFVHVIAWTKVEEFPLMLRNRIMDLGEAKDPHQIAEIISSQLTMSPANGGFVRMPMSDLEYLIRDIKLPLWCQIMIVIIGGAVSFGVSVWLVKNNIN